MCADTRLEELGVSGLGEVDEPAFSGLAERHRRELHVHCYRMLWSFGLHLVPSTVIIPTLARSLLSELRRGSRQV